MSLKKMVELTDAYDLRNADPKRNYGIHGSELRMVLKGPCGAVQFVLFTNRHLPHICEDWLARLGQTGAELSAEQARRFRAYSGAWPSEEVEEVVREIQRFDALLRELSPHDGHGFTEMDVQLCAPLPADRGYHSPKPMCDGDEPVRHTLRSPKFLGTDAEGVPQITPGVYGDPIICPYLDGDQPCYYGGSGLDANRLYQALLEGGAAAVWAELEIYYGAVFLEG